MISSLMLKNYRCFKDIEIHNLSRINLIVGANASGKTTLLEALYMVAGASPQLYFRTLGWRGLKDIRISTDKLAYESVFRNLFAGLDQGSPIQMSFVDTLSGERSLTISYSETGLVEMSPLVEMESISSPALTPIRFRWGIGGKTYEAKIEIAGDKLKFETGGTPYRVHFINTQTLAAPTIWAEHFSNLSRQKATDKLQSAVNRIFPQIDEISVGIDSGGAVLFASVKGLGEKLPLVLISAGVSKTVSLLIAAAVSRGGVVVVDEIENGLYFGKMELIWASLVELCKENDTQLFATTHSRECLIAWLFWHFSG